MSRRRFFASKDAFKQRTVTLTADEARHLRDVLRLNIGDEAYVFDGEGKEFRCEVAELKRDLVLLNKCAEVEPARPESPLRLTLGVALLKGEKFDLVVQKTTELGVTNIIPVTTRYADIHLSNAVDADKRVNRWTRIALEAAKQSGRAQVPKISLPVTFESLLTNAPDGLRILFSERDGEVLEAALQSATVNEHVTMLTGSEGGWSQEEIQLAKDAGWRIVTLGGRVLRAETAAITVIVLLQHALGDLR